MDLLEETDQITKLIIFDMKNTKLLYGLDQMSFDISPYQVSICNTVFTMSYIPLKNQTDDLTDWYNKQTERALKVDINDWKQLHQIAEDILLGLIHWKKNEALPSPNTDFL